MGRARVMLCSTLFSSSTFAAIGMGSGLDPRGEMSKGEGKGGDCVGQRQ